MSISFVKVYDIQGDMVGVALSEEPRIDAAVSKWVDSGKTQDTLLSLETPDGSEYKTLASAIQSWLVSTPEIRRRKAEIEAELQAEMPDTQWMGG